MFNTVAVAARAVAVVPEAFFASTNALHKAKPPQVCGLRGFWMKEIKFLNQSTLSEVDLCADRENALIIGSATGVS